MTLLERCIYNYLNIPISLNFRCADRPYFEYCIVDPKGKHWSNVIFFRLGDGLPFVMKRMMAEKGTKLIYFQRGFGFNFDIGIGFVFGSGLVYVLVSLLDLVLIGLV
jgi:hypothetical protein